MTNRLPIVGFPHLFLAAQEDARFRQRILTGLKDAGFTVEAERIIPPQNANSRHVIAAMTAAFQEAKRA